MFQASNLSEVINHLDHIIAWSKTNKSPIGYFATVYRCMTIAVQKAIANKSFQDGKRMETLDTIFANRYLVAWDAYVNKKACTRSWTNAFNACSNNNLTVIQHLILGINTHINLDLAIAAAETSPAESIFGLQTDFEKINDVIASLTEVVQENLCKVWFPLRILGKISNHQEDAVVNFSISSARKASWANAIALAASQGMVKDNYIGIIDDGVVNIADRIINPGLRINFLLRPVRMMESKDIVKIIDLLTVSA